MLGHIVHIKNSHKMDFSRKKGRCTIFHSTVYVQFKSIYFDSQTTPTH